MPGSCEFTSGNETGRPGANDRDLHLCVPDGEGSPSPWNTRN